MWAGGQHRAQAPNVQSGVGQDLLTKEGESRRSWSTETCLPRQDALLTCRSGNGGGNCGVAASTLGITLPARHGDKASAQRASKDVTGMWGQSSSSDSLPWSWEQIALGVHGIGMLSFCCMLRIKDASYCYKCIQTLQIHPCPQNASMPYKCIHDLQMHSNPASALKPYKCTQVQQLHPNCTNALNLC